MPYRHNCRCRKPAPGLVERALAEWEIDAGRSFMIGDRESDLLAARAAGIRGALFTGGTTLIVMMGFSTS